MMQTADSNLQCGLEREASQCHDFALCVCTLKLLRIGCTLSFFEYFDHYVKVILAILPQ